MISDEWEVRFCRRVPSLSIAALKGLGILLRPAHLELGLNLQIEIPDNQRGMRIISQKIFLTTTLCHFGGARWWFLCPSSSGENCLKRVGILYLRGGRLGCRVCQNLIHKSRRRNYRGPYRVFGKLVELHASIRQSVQSARTKRWKGRFTKKYRNTIKKMEDFNDLSSLILDSEIDSMELIARLFNKK